MHERWENVSCVAYSRCLSASSAGCKIRIVFAVVCCREIQARFCAIRKCRRCLAFEFHRMRWRSMSVGLLPVAFHVGGQRFTGNHVKFQRLFLLQFSGLLRGHFPMKMVFNIEFGCCWCGSLSNVKKGMTKRLNLVLERVNYWVWNFLIFWRCCCCCYWFLAGGSRGRLKFDTFDIANLVWCSTPSRNACIEVFERTI